jgi:hypothetical protein
MSRIEARTQFNPQSHRLTQLQACTYVIPKMNYTVVLDRATSERCGAGGMFQVVTLEDEHGTECTHLVDQGKHYSSLSQIARDIAQQTNTPVNEIEVEEEPTDG